MTSVDFRPPEPGPLRALNLEYMDWIDTQLAAHFGVSLIEISGQSVERYVDATLDKACGEPPPRGCFHLLWQDGACLGMGGLRTLAPGVGEIKRVYLRPAARGRGLAEALLQRLLSEARAFGLHTLRLDSAPFMRAAQTLYERAGFVDRPPYPETEVPAAFQARWRFMERGL
jgi:GNAT superfamily N-acetyltransferase